MVAFSEAFVTAFFETAQQPDIFWLGISGSKSVKRRTGVIAMMQSPKTSGKVVAGDYIHG